MREYRVLVYVYVYPFIYILNSSHCTCMCNFVSNSYIGIMVMFTSVYIQIKGVSRQLFDENNSFVEDVAEDGDKEMGCSRAQSVHQI